jgi:hypothetical protein
VAGYAVGDQVSIRERTFAGMEGHVAEVWPAKQLLRVSLTIFGQTVPVELEFWQLDPPPPLTEADWLACTRAEKMLCYLRGRASDRKPRLLACACFGRLRCRSRRSPRLLETAE